MDEIDAIPPLGEFRADTPPMSEQARLHGRRRLLAGAADRRAGRWTGRRALRLRPRSALLATALTLAITAGVVGSQIAGPGATETSAQAISVLNLAADAIDVAPAPAPRPDQFVYLDVMHTTSDLNDQTDVRIWSSVDGSKDGLIESAGGYNHTDTVPAHQSATGLEGAPYAVLAALPTDPDQLLQRLYADVWVHEQQQNNKVSREVAVWSLLRNLMESACPAPQQAALFRAAARIPHITYSPDATDAAGRDGEAVGMLDPRVGLIQLILDRGTHKFLGERVLDNPGRTGTGKMTMELNSTVRTVAVVDRAGQLP